MFNVEYVRLQGEAPTGEAGIAIFRTIQPGQRTVIGFDREGPSEEIHLEGLYGEFDREALLFHRRVALLTRKELSTEVCHWVFQTISILLGKYSPGGDLRCIRL